MFVILDVLFFVLFASAQSLPDTGLISSRLEGKIVNGSVVEDGDKFSLVVSVKVDDKHNCGGYMIAGSHVLTAGHCVADVYFKSFVSDVNRLVYRFSVYVGSLHREVGGKRYGVIHMEFHPDIKPYTHGHPHDIALLTLREEVTGIPFVDLPEEGKAIKPGAIGEVGGWGLMSDLDKSKGPAQNLRSLMLTVMPEEYCKSRISHFDANSQFCTEKHENEFLFLGDCGSPFLFGGSVWGINIFARNTSPAIFSMITFEMDFINGAKCRGEERRKALCEVFKPSSYYALCSDDEVSSDWGDSSDDADSLDDVVGSDKKVTSYKYPSKEGYERFECKPPPLKIDVPKWREIMSDNLCEVNKSSSDSEVSSDWTVSSDDDGRSDDEVSSHKEVDPLTKDINHLSVSSHP